jgi:hypothetical protein
MPTVYRFAGYRAFIFTNDQRPAHVHVTGGVGEAVFSLNCPDGPTELRESYGFSRKQLMEIKEKLDPVVDGLCKAWSEIHGGA